MIVISFSIGFGVSSSVSADSSSISGTSIPVKKGGTGSTTEQGALQNLLPDFDSNNGKVLGSTGSAITWVDQNNPEIQSSNDVGKVKVDDTDKTMSTNGEIGVNGTSKVSINRPDLWTVGVEYDFGNNLYGYRKQETNINFANTDTVYQFPIIPNDDGRIILDFGGYWTHTVSILTSRFMIGTESQRVESKSWSSIWNKALRISTQTAGTDGMYDVWITYKK
jgi:hypothetical protein